MQIMNKYDFTPVIQSRRSEILLRMFFMGLPCVILGHFLVAPAFGYALLQGIVIGIMDAMIMMQGIKKALPYVKEPKKGLKIMKRYRWYRLIAISTIILLLLRQNAPVLGTFVGVLLTHILYIFQLTFIAYQLEKKDTWRKE